jgi:hypothetical protein
MKLKLAKKTKNTTKNKPIKRTLEELNNYLQDYLEALKTVNGK